MPALLISGAEQIELTIVNRASHIESAHDAVKNVVMGVALMLDQLRCRDAFGALEGVGHPDYKGDVFLNIRRN